jgi:Uma2 family endonuclease
VIEVAGDSLRRDRHIKAALYARGGIPEYWIVNVEAQVIEAFADPDAAAGAYRRTRTVAASEIIASEALPPVSFSVSDLFA